MCELKQSWPPRAIKKYRNCTVAFRREKTKIEFPKESEKSSSGTKPAEKGRKRLFEERIERRMVKSDM